MILTTKIKRLIIVIVLVAILYNYMLSRHFTSPVIGRSRMILFSTNKATVKTFFYAPYGRAYLVNFSCKSPSNSLTGYVRFVHNHKVVDNYVINCVRPWGSRGFCCPERPGREIASLVSGQKYELIAQFKNQPSTELTCQLLYLAY